MIARRIDLLVSGDSQLFDHPLTPSQQAWVDKLYRQIGQRGVKAFADPVTGSNPRPQSADETAPCVPPNPSTATKPSNRAGAETAAVSLFASESTERPAPFALEQIEHSHATSAGAELVGLHAWEQLKISQALRCFGLNDAQLRCAQATVINRLVDPVSEHALGPWLTQCSSLPDLLRESFEGKHTEGRFYRVADLLHQNAPALEAHLRKQQEALFGSRPTVFLYDLTNTYFEGQAAGNPEARHGHSKEKRTDCPLVSIALAYSQDGLPLGHKVFAGNQNDAASFPEMLARLTTEWRDLCPPGQRALFVMDCGIGTPANCLHLRQHHHDYLVSERRSCRSTFAATFAEHATFTQIEGKTVRVKMQTSAMPPDAPALAPASSAPASAASSAPAAPAAEPVPASNPATAEGQPWEETRLFCRSEARGEKEKAMLAKASARFEADLQKLAKSMSGGRVTTSKKIHERLGRLKERHASVSRYYEITVLSEAPCPPCTPTTPPEASSATGAASAATPRTPSERPTLGWARKDEAANAEALCGDYCLHSNRRFESAAQMWTLYTDLTHAEDGFRSLKTDLGLRPVHHQTTERVKAHIFISVLALHLLCYLKKRLHEAAQPARTWTTLKRLLSDHAYVTLTLQTEHTTHHLRRLGKPNQEQSALYKALGLKLADCPQTRLHVPR